MEEKKTLGQMSYDEAVQALLPYIDWVETEEERIEVINKFLAMALRL